MNGPVPITSTMYAERPERIVAPGCMWMSGTSFAAPVVAGAAAHILSVKPGWTPDQVKGALMLAAVPPPNATPNALGVGAVKANAAARTASPPNPNAALNTFLVADPSGGATPVFDAAAWQSAAWQSGAMSESVLPTATFENSAYAD